MFEAQPRSSPTAMVRITSERTTNSFAIRQTGNGQSGQNFAKKWLNGFQTSKKTSQLETRTATEPAKSFNSGMRSGGLGAEARQEISRTAYPGPDKFTWDASEEERPVRWNVFLHGRQSAF